MICSFLAEDASLVYVAVTYPVKTVVDPAASRAACVPSAAGWGATAWDPSWPGAVAVVSAVFAYVSTVSREALRLLLLRHPPPPKKNFNILSHI